MIDTSVAISSGRLKVDDSWLSTPTGKCMRRQHYHLKHCWRPGRTLRVMSPMLILDNHFGYYDEFRQFRKMSDEWEVAFKASEIQNMHEVPGSLPYLIE
eukprot:167337-Karenia_brevis.AAC.1